MKWLKIHIEGSNFMQLGRMNAQHYSNCRLWYIVACCFWSLLISGTQIFGLCWLLAIFKFLIFSVDIHMKRENFTLKCLQVSFVLIICNIFWILYPKYLIARFHHCLVLEMRTFFILHRYWAKTRTRSVCSNSILAAGSNLRAI